MSAINFGSVDKLKLVAKNLKGNLRVGDERGDQLTSAQAEELLQDAHDLLATEFTIPDDLASTTRAYRMVAALECYIALFDLAPTLWGGDDSLGARLEDLERSIDRRKKMMLGDPTPDIWIEDPTDPYMSHFGIIDALYDHTAGEEDAIDDEQMGYE